MDNFKTVNNDLDNLVGVEGMKLDIFDKVFGVDKKTGEIWVMTSHINDEVIGKNKEIIDIRERLNTALYVSESRLVKNNKLEKEVLELIAENLELKGTNRSQKSRIATLDKELNLFRNSKLGEFRQKYLDSIKGKS